MYLHERRLNDLTLANEKLKLQLEDRERTINRLENLAAATTPLNNWRLPTGGARGLPRSVAAYDDIDIDRRRRERDSNRYEQDVSRENLR
jgi:hypothetical protein